MFEELVNNHSSSLYKCYQARMTGEASKIAFSWPGLILFEYSDAMI